MTRQPERRSPAIAIYRALLILLPEDMRKRDGDEIDTLFAD